MLKLASGEPKCIISSVFRHGPACQPVQTSERDQQIIVEQGRLQTPADVGVFAVGIAENARGRTKVHTQVLRQGATSRFYAQLINNLNLILWQAWFIAKI